MHPPRDHCMYPPCHAGFAAADAAAVDIASAQAATAHADEEEEETQEQYNHKFVKMDKAREHGVVCIVL